MDISVTDAKLGFVAALVDRVLDALERSRECRQALALDDRMLRDIGASRSDIERRVSER